ncbi:MAG: CDP-diacylglycerol--glycerol-3-phosphate 3-phosphatidyltransferase [Gammaproteobacteria bacterium]|nr:MAG: CDP-diacylglycerol--glycerol-3-phosphate 3-phosphatidyltransferase [Gammaproteobacteria bacterium]
MRQLPNVLTLVRICLVIPVALELHAGHYRNAIGLFLFAGLTDALDGYLARRFDWRTRFGALADPVADKLFLVTTFIILALSDRVPLWLMIVALGRDLWIVTGVLVYRILRGQFEIRPSVWGKLSTFTQIGYLATVIVHAAGVDLLAPILEPLTWAVAALAVLSGLDYTRQGWIRVRTRQEGRH